MPPFGALKTTLVIDTEYVPSLAVAGILIAIAATTPVARAFWLTPKIITMPVDLLTSIDFDASFAAEPADTEPILQPLGRSIENCNAATPVEPAVKVIGKLTVAPAEPELVPASNEGESAAPAAVTLNIFARNRRHNKLLNALRAVTRS